MSDVVDTMMNIKSKLSNLSVAKLSLPSWAIPKRSTSQETPAIQASGSRQASSSRSYAQNEDLSQVINEPVYKPMKPPTPAEVLISLEAAFFTEVCSWNIQSITVRFTHLMKMQWNSGLEFFSLYCVLFSRALRTQGSLACSTMPLGIHLLNTLIGSCLYKPF